MMAVNALEELLKMLIENILALLPQIAKTLLILVIGWIAGKCIYIAVKKFIEKIGVDSTFKDSILGRALARFGMTISSFVASSIKWFIYALALMSAIDIWGIPVLSHFTQIAVEYLPNFFGGILIFVVGMIISEILAQIIDESLSIIKVPYIKLASLFSRILLYSIVVVTALLVMKIDVTILYALLNALFWGIALGIGAAIGIAFGLGLKDEVARSARRWFQLAGATEEKVAEKEYEKKIKEYKKKIENLEKELAKEKETVKELKEKKEEKIKEYERMEMDLNGKLKSLIKDSGRILCAHGGYSIEVSEPGVFPWVEVLVTLVANGYKVSLEKRDQKYIIEATLKRK